MTSLTSGLYLEVATNDKSTSNITRNASNKGANNKATKNEIIVDRIRYLEEEENFQVITVICYRYLHRLNSVSVRVNDTKTSKSNQDDVNTKSYIQVNQHSRINPLKLGHKRLFNDSIR